MKENIKLFIIQLIPMVVKITSHQQQKVRILEEYRMNKENRKEN